MQFIAPKNTGFCLQRNFLRVQWSPRQYNCIVSKIVKILKPSITLITGLALATASLAQSNTGASPVVLNKMPLLPVFAPQRVQPGRDRFNNTPSLTNEGLVETLKTNKTFRTNLAKHFGVPEERVIEFVQDALVPQTLAQNTRVMNYGVTKSGLIYSKNTTLKKGTRVWATRDGKPMLNNLLTVHNG